MSDPRCETNPIFGANRLKLGVFGLNGPGVAFTTVPELFDPTWANSDEVTRIADAMGIEALVPYSRWKAFHRKDHGQALETSAWAAAASVRTHRACVMSTTHVPAYAPVIAAKTAATTDRISGGRYGVNIVCGWFKAEIEMFGTLQKAHDDRYAVADEWIAIQKRLWTEDDPFDFEGRFFQIRDALIEPKPVQPGGPAIMNAGVSGRGQHFAAKNADIAFTSIRDQSLDAVKAQVAAYKRLAWEEYGRTIQVWVHGYVVQRDSRQEARDYVDYYVLERGDQPMCDLFLRNNVPDLDALPAVAIHDLRYRMMAGSGGYPLLGSADEITETMLGLSRAGLDGVLLTWLDYKSGLSEFERTVLPLLEQSGLRTQPPALRHGMPDLEGV